MVSESQERMLAVVEPAKVDEVLALCAKWETGGAAIGEVTDGEQIRVFDGGDLVGEMPVALLVDDCPLYDLEPAEPDEWIYGNHRTLAAPTPPGTGLGTAGALAGVEAEPRASEVLLALLASPTIASKRWAFEQYDPIVQSRTVRRPEQADAAVLQIEQTGTAIAVSIDGNGRRVACDPFAGTVEAALECAQNLACVGAEPLGVTNCLNFGNPEKPTIAWQLQSSVEGLAAACEALGLPVVGGNVSLYNETDAGPIYPTPVIGMVGELPDPSETAGIALRDGDAIAIVGPFAPSLAGSELAKQRGELGFGLGEFEVEAVAEAIADVRAAVRAGRLRVAHDVSDGGLASALAECAIAGRVGLSADLSPLAEERGGDGEAWLFGEGPGGFVVAGDPEEIDRMVAEGMAIRVGDAGGARISIAAGDAELDVGLGEAEAAWRSLETALTG
jgi:phosphoribosylformylglycinamidine synthase